MSNLSIMSVRELIDMAFGDTDGTVVNFKIIQTILYLLARQLRVLGRNVEVDVDPALGVTSRTTFTVTEVKMHAAVPKKKKKAKGLSDMKGEKNATEKSISTKTIDRSHAGKEILITKGLKRGPSDPNYGSETKDYNKLLEEIEEQRERELRVIRQRASSREEAEPSPTPMASLDSLELEYEKLLVVERIPSEDSKLIDDKKVEGKTRQLSVVTQKQFQELANTVHELQTRFGGIASANFPDNIALMQELRKGASLTDSMAALQMSARLDAVEKTLKQMLSLVTDLALKIPEESINTKWEYKDESSTLGGNKKTAKKIYKASSGKEQPSTLPAFSEEVSTFENIVNNLDTQEGVKKQEVWITSIDLERALQELQTAIMKEVTNISNSNIENANSALKISKALERKLAGTSQLESRMEDLEILVSDYADQINNLDIGLSAQMTNYQEQLNQMQHDLEIGLENMTEALTNTGGDTTAIAELNANFAYLHEEFDKATLKQKDLQEIQSSFHVDLKTIWKQIEKLNEAKPDREEISDALRDKADLKSLNGLVTQLHFDAVRGDLEKNIGAAYEKFNNQELVWQKAIDDIFRELNEKIELSQFDSLRQDVNNHIQMLHSRIQDMMDILGEPRAAAITRKLFRDTACLSCATPANMDITHADTVPVVPVFVKTSVKQKPSGNETLKAKGDGDHYLCYPGRPITHSIDPRAQFCRRYCGGGNATRPTLKPVAKTAFIHFTSTGIGSDGKAYIVEGHEQPCIPCNFDLEQNNSIEEQHLDANLVLENKEQQSNESANLSSKEEVEKEDDCKCETLENSVSVTPTLPMDDD